jgi:hypothetical protein
MLRRAGEQLFLKRNFYHVITLINYLILSYLVMLSKFLWDMCADFIRSLGHFCITISFLAEDRL